MIESNYYSSPLEMKLNKPKLLFCRDYVWCSSGSKKEWRMESDDCGSAEYEDDISMLQDAWNNDRRNNM